MKDAAIFAIYWCVTRIAARLPMGLAFRIGSLVGALAWWAWPAYRRLVRSNLRIAFSDQMSKREIRRMARRIFRRTGANLLSNLAAASMKPGDVAKRMEWHGLERAERFCIEGRGFIGACTHTGNWEALTSVIAVSPRMPIGVIYQRLANRFIDRDVRRFRTASGATLFDRKSEFLSATRHLKNGGALAVLMDQHAGDHGVWVPVFGRLASTSPVPASLAIRFGAPVIPIAVETIGTARWRVTLGEPLEPEGDSAEAFTARITAQIHAMLERSPEDWFWLHNRWKTPHPEFLLSNYKRGIALPAGFSPSELKPFRILVRSSNWLGDAVMSVPAIRAIRAGRPDARITVLAPAKLADFWRRVPEVADVIPIAARDSVFAVARKISGRFDAGIIFPNSPRTALEMALAGIPRRVGAATQGRAPLLNQTFEHHAKPGPPRHQSHHYLDIAESLGAPKDRERFLRFPLKAPSGDGPLRVGVCPGAEFGPAKRWPAERFADTAKLLNLRQPCAWVLFGLEADREAGIRIANALNRQCTNLIGRTTLAELLDQLAACDLLLTNDTGTMHLAAFLGVPVAAVFGSTEPALTGPLGEGHLVLRRHVECSPCFLRECPLDLRCMRELTSAAVADRIARAWFRTRAA